MIILVGSEKGGCGKSTTAVNLCAELARQGKDVLLIDSDRQATAHNWAQDRASRSDNRPPVHCIQKYDAIRDTVLDSATRYEFVVIDAAGRDSRELRTGLTCANICLVPFRPSQPDLDTMKKMQALIETARDFNPGLTVFSVFTMAPTNPSIREVQEAKEYLQDYPSLSHLLKTVISDRKIYRDCMSEGLGVVEMDNGKAKGEIQLVLKEILNG